MSFSCLKTSAGSPSPTLGNSPNSLPWHSGSSINMPFQLMLVISLCSAHLQTLSTCCYSSMLLSSLLCLECLSLFTLPAMSIFVQSFTVQHTCCLLSEPPSPVDSMSPLPAFLQHSLCPPRQPLPHHILILSGVVSLSLKPMSS